MQQKHVVAKGSQATVIPAAFRGLRSKANSEALRLDKALTCCWSQKRIPHMFCYIVVRGSSLGVPEKKCFVFLYVNFAFQLQQINTVSVL